MVELLPIVDTSFLELGNNYPSYKQKELFLPITLSVYMIYNAAAKSYNINNTICGGAMYVWANGYSPDISKSM